MGKTFVLDARCATAEERSYDFAEGPCYDLMKDLRLQFLGIKHDQIEAGDGSSAHSVDITDRIGCCNLAEGVGIVHRRHDEVCGGDQGDFIREAIDARIITGVKADEKIGILVFRQLSQKAPEPDRVEFGRSPAGLGQAHQGRLLKQLHHFH